MNDQHYPCPCCGYLQFTEPPGSFQLCQICGWEDDSLQLQYPEEAGTNPVSLLEAQQNVLAMGVCSSERKEAVRAPGARDEREPGWYPLSPEQHHLPRFEAWEKLAEDGPQSELDLYYWRPGAWAQRRKSGVRQGVIQSG